MKDRRDIFRKRPVLTCGTVSYSNWWNENPETSWFTRLLHSWFPDNDVPVRMYSVFGPRRTIEEPFDGVKIFFSGENLEPWERYPELSEREEKVAGWAERMHAFEDYGGSFVSLALGFGERTQERYMRFPLWVMRYFEPEDDAAAIQARLDEINRKAKTAADQDSREGAVVIASHDFFGTRAAIADAVSPAVSVTYGGRWRNSTDALWNECGDDKEKFLTRFLFNICPENMDASGYTTEKIFDAYAAGTIPIYRGSIGSPEPDVLSQNAYVHWEYEGDHTDSLELIRRIATDPEFRRQFLQRPRFLPGAGERIFNRYYVPLREKLSQILVHV